MITKETLNKYFDLQNLIESKANYLIRRYNRKHKTDFDLDYVDDDGIWITEYKCGEGNTIKLPLKKLYDDGEK